MSLIPSLLQHLLYFHLIEHFLFVPCPIHHYLESHFQILVASYQLNPKILQYHDLVALTRHNYLLHQWDNLQQEMSPRSGRTPTAANIPPYVISHYYCYHLRPTDNNFRYSHFSTAHLNFQNSPFFLIFIFYKFYYFWGIF